MRILLDQDEVICEWGKRVLEWWNQDHGTSLTLEDIKTWAFEETLGEHSDAYIRAYIRYPGFYQTLEPVPGAVDGVRKLMARGHDVMIVSSVPKQAGFAYEGKLEWLREHIPEFPLDSFGGFKRKDAVAGDLLVDDGLHNLDPYRLAWPNASTVVFDRPWNREGASLHHHRVKGWPELLKLVRDLEPYYRTRSWR